MKRRRWMFIGFVLGYLWLWFKPIRRIFKDAFAEAFMSIPRDAFKRFFEGLFFGEDKEEAPKEDPISRIREALYPDGEEPTDPLTKRVFGYQTARNRMPQPVMFRCDSKESCEQILESMHELLEEFGVVTVADLYDLTGTTRGPSEREWSWHKLDDVEITQMDRGWRITFPTPTNVE